MRTISVHKEPCKPSRRVQLLDPSHPPRSVEEAVGGGENALRGGQNDAKPLKFKRDVPS